MHTVSPPARAYYRAALLGLRALEAREGRERRFGADADARWGRFRGKLHEGDRLHVLLRDASAPWGLASAAAHIFQMPGVARDEPFGPAWPSPSPAEARRLLDEADQAPTLAPFDHERLVEVGRKVRALYPAKAPERVQAKVTDEIVGGLAEGVAGRLGGKTGVAPRIYLKKLVLNVLDKVDQFEAFDPLHDYSLVIDPETELRPEERAAMAGTATPDDIDLDL